MTEQGSPDSVRALLAADTHCVLLVSLTHLTVTDPPSLKLAFVKTFMSLSLSCAETIGPSLWGLSQEFGTLKEEARVMLDQTFQVCTPHL